MYGKNNKKPRLWPSVWDVCSLPAFTEKQGNTDLEAVSSSAARGLVMCSRVVVTAIDIFKDFNTVPPSGHSPLHSCALHYVNVIRPISPVHTHRLSLVIGEGSADIEGNCFPPSKKHTSHFILLHKEDLLHLPFLLSLPLVPPFVQDFPSAALASL